MIKVLKSNKMIVIFLIIMCIVLAFNPMLYAKSCLNAISVWAFKVLPLLFPFFVLTRLIVNLSTNKHSFMDNVFNKIYKTRCCSFSTFLLSALAGYPMGAKLICSLYESKKIEQIEAKKMMSFCSISGPMFMLGTVGIAMLSSFSAGIIILISNLLASLINGLFYGKEMLPIIEKKEILTTKSNNLLADSVYDSLVSILMVGCYIVLSFIFIDILNNLKITDFLTKTICVLFKISSHSDIVKCTINGTIEITRGILNLSSTQAPIAMKIVISSGLIGFGGISIMLQSISFVSKLKIPLKTLFKQKLSQGALAVIISSLICLIFL